MTVQPTLLQFTQAYRSEGISPPVGSNSYYTVGQGRVNLLRQDETDYHILTDEGTLYTGAGNFLVSDHISESIYRMLTVISGTKLFVTKTLTIAGGTMHVYGGLELMQHAQLVLRDNAKVIFYAESEFNVGDTTEVLVEPGSTLVTYGKINIHVSQVHRLLSAYGVTIDTAATMNVSGIPKNNRPMSLTEYEETLRDLVINTHTQGEYNSHTGRIGYVWTAGTPLDLSQVIRINVLRGDAVLGDFKLSVTGIPEEVPISAQIVSDLHVQKGTRLFITENYNGARFIHPELYIGGSGECIVDGSIIVDGNMGSIVLDRGGTMRIQEGGLVDLRNEGDLRSSYNEGKVVLHIDGTLAMDDIDQIATLDAENIVFGDNGKVVIRNPSEETRRLLFTTPDGILESDLYRIFRGTIDHVEYHVSANTGIGIDRYFPSYSRDMTKWFGDRRIEQAIHDGILVWHDGGFIEAYHHVIPWINVDSTLYDAAKLFKSFGETDAEILQDVVNRLRYAGCENILFRFVDGDDAKQVLMDLNGISIVNEYDNLSNGMHVMETSADGKVFLKNKVNGTEVDPIIRCPARIVPITDRHAEFHI